MAPNGVPTKPEYPYPTPGSFTLRSRLNVSRLAAERLARSIELLLRRQELARWFLVSCDGTADAIDVVASDFGDAVDWSHVEIVWSDSDANVFEATSRRSYFAKRVRACFIDVAELAATSMPLNYLWTALQPDWRLAGIADGENAPTGVGGVGLSLARDAYDISVFALGPSVKDALNATLRRDNRSSATRLAKAVTDRGHHITWYADRETY